MITVYNLSALISTVFMYSADLCAYVVRMKFYYSDLLKNSYAFATIKSEALLFYLQEDGK